MKKARGVAAIVLSVGLVAAGQFHYAFYYDLSGGQDLEINLMNTMPWTNEFVVGVHDAYGGLIWESEGEMEGYETLYVRLGDEIPAESTNWGVVTVDSEDRIIVGLEYYLDGSLVSMDTVYAEIPVIDAGEPYWLGTYYSQVGSSETAYIVMNPWATTAQCSVTAYDAEGDAVHYLEFVLGPYESEYVLLSSEIGSGGLLYGFLDVQMEDQVIVVALEYTGRGCSGLEIVNVTEYYF